MSYRARFRATRSSQPFRSSTIRQFFQRRWQGTATENAQQTAESAAKKENLNPFAWNSPVGPKTVHFWAPIMKWGLVFATFADFTRPADKLSLAQSASLAATGAIWTRWCLIIKPKNYLLAAVNFFLFLANGTQVGRILSYQQSQKGKGVVEEVKDAAKEVEAKVENVVESVTNKK